MNTDLFNSAIEYVKLGWKIVPLKGKQPVPGFQWGDLRDKETTEEDVQNWFESYKGVITGLGLITGYTESICVLDLESNEDPTKYVIPETVSSRSGGGGWHYYFSIPDEMDNQELPTTDLRKFGITGELRADKTYTTLPPSAHPSGGKYEWIIPLEIEKLAPLPQWLLDLVKKNTSQQTNWEETIQGATEGSRNTTTVKVAGKLLYHFPETEWGSIVLPMLKSWNKEHNTPPLSDKEVVTIFKSLAQRREKSGNTDGYINKNSELDESAFVKRKILTVSDIFSMPEEEKPEFLVDKLVPEKGIIAVSGHPGCGKSWFMLHMAQCIASGEKFLGEMETKKGNVLIVDEENGVWEMKRRIQLLGYSENANIHFYCQSGFKIDKKRDLDELLDVITKQNIKLVIFDPFVAIHSKVENSAEDAQIVMENLQKFNLVGASVLFIHHHRKGVGSGGQSLRGSSAFSGRLDSHITVEKSNETDTTTSMDIDHAKSRRGKNLAPFRIILTQETPESLISITHDNEIGTVTIKKEKAKRLIVELLKLGGLTTDEIVVQIQKEGDIGNRNINQALKDLETDKLVNTHRDGKKKKYVLVDTQDEIMLFGDEEVIDS